MKFVKTAVFALGLLFLTQMPTMAQDAAETEAAATPEQAVSINDQARLAAAPAPKGIDTRAIGAGLVLIGAGVGIGWVGAFAVSGMARQPEVAGNIQTAMIIAAALIEGVAFFALIIIMLFLPQY